MATANSSCFATHIEPSYREAFLVGERHRRFHGAAARRAARLRGGSPTASLLCRGDEDCMAMPGPAGGHSVECVQMLCAADREKGIVAKLAQSR